MAEINTSYLNNTSILRTAFLQQGYIQLREFLEVTAFFHTKQRMQGAAWKQKTVWDQYNYLSAKIPFEIKKYLAGKHFLKFLSEVTGKKITHLVWSALQFKRGNYSLLNDHQPPDNGIMLEFDLTTMQDSGFTSYIVKGQEFLRVTPLKNTLTIIKMNNTRSFIKYVNCNAGKRSRILLRGRVVYFVH